MVMVPSPDAVPAGTIGSNGFRATEALARSAAGRTATIDDELILPTGTASQDGTTGPDSLGVGYATDRETCSAELQAKGAGREERYPIHRSRCACRDDRRRSRGGERGGSLAGSNPEPAGTGAEAGTEAGAGAVDAGLLRGRAMRLRALLAAGWVGRALRRGGTDLGTGQSGRPGQDRPARRAEAGAQLSQRRPDRGLGAGCSARGTARLGACPRGGEEGPTARPAPAAEVSAPTRTTACGGNQVLDIEASQLGENTAPRAIRA